MSLSVGVGPGLDLLLEPILVSVQSMVSSHPLQVGDKTGRAASFLALVKEEFLRKVETLLENNRKA